MSCGCNDSNNFTCCTEPQYAQDKICNDWTLLPSTAASDTVAYSSNRLVTGSGYVKYDVGASSVPVTVDILRGTVAVDTVVLEEGGSFSFTADRFNSIEISTTAGSTVTLEGEICVTPRYRLR